MSSLLAEAEDAAGLAAGPLLRAQAFAAVARHAGDLQERATFLRCLKQTEPHLPKLQLADRVFVLANLVKGAIGLGLADLAERLATDAAASADRVRTTALRGLVRAKAAQLLAMVGKADEALAMVARIASKSDLARRDQVKVLVQLGHLDQALEAACLIPADDWRADYIGRVAIAFAKQGRTDRAREAAGMIRDAGWRATVLAEVAALIGPNAG